MTTEAGRARPGIRKRTWLLLTLGAVILIATVWSALGGPGLDRSPALEPPSIPNPNGYDDVLEAGREIEKSGLTGAKLDVEKADQAALEPVVQGTREAVARGRKGIDKPFQVPVVYDLKQMMNVLMPDLGSIRGGLVRALLAQGRLAEDCKGRVDEAASCYADVIRLGHAMSQRVPMIAYMVAAAIQSGGLHHLRDLRTKLSAEQCREMIALLEETDRNRELSADVTLRESQFMDANLKKMGFFARFSMKISGMHKKGWRRLPLSAGSSEKPPERRTPSASDRPGRSALPPGAWRGTTRFACARPLDPEIRADRPIQRPAAALPEERQRRHCLQLRPRPRRRQADQDPGPAPPRNRRRRLHDRLVLSRSGFSLTLFQTRRRGRRSSTRILPSRAPSCVNETVSSGFKISRDACPVAHGPE